MCTWCDPAQEAERIADEALTAWRKERALKRLLQDPRTWAIARAVDDALWDLLQQADPLDGLDLIDRWRDPSDPGPRGERRRRQPAWRPRSILGLDAWND
jgi:hypothetical protein